MTLTGCHADNSKKKVSALIGKHGPEVIVFFPLLLNTIK